MSTITNYVVGIVVGLIVCLIIVLILQNTAFKGKNMSLLYVIMFILFAICGGFIQSSYFTVHADAIPTPQEQIDEITATIKDNWKNTNGGFTFEQIKKAQDDNDCPYYDDQIISLKCSDFGSYVVFSYYNNGTYENAVFYKASNGLILDGIMNMNANLTDVKWFLAYNLDKFSWTDNRSSDVNYTITHTPISWDVINGRYDNLVSVSRQNTDFVRYNYKFRTNKDEMTRFALKNASNITGQNATSHFIKFGNVELIGNANEGFVKINSFYNYLYEQVKGQSYNTTKLIDGSNCLCLPIPDSLQKNYPISADKKAEYGDVDYYGVYRCNIAVETKWVKGNTTVNATSKNEDYIDTLENDDNYKDKVKVDKVDSTASYAKLKATFRDTNSSDLTNLNLLTKPVKIQFSCAELNLNKVVTIDSINKLNSGVDILLNKDVSWDFYIESEGLIFESFKGNFMIKNDTSSITFDYYYLDNYTVASVGLNPIGTVDYSLVDLSSKPIKIILSNTDHTYQFVFDNNSMLDQYVNMLVEMGTYNYTILSEELEFASVTGTLTITTVDKVMLFNYAQIIDDGSLKFNVSVYNYGSTSNCFKLYSDTSNVTAIRDTLSSAKVYTVTCVIYDKDGKLMETFNHTHSSTGSCADTWYSSNLVVGQNYTLQLRFADRDDSTITYLSDVTTFTFETGVTYRVEYNLI